MAGRFMVGANAIIEKDGLVLITKRSPTRWHGNEWEFVSGRLEQGEDIIDGLKREVKEEVGVEIDPLFPVCTGHFYRGEVKPENELIFVTYACRYISGEVRLKQDEQCEYAWVKPEELLAYETLKHYFLHEIQNYGEFKKHGLI